MLHEIAICDDEAIVRNQIQDILKSMDIHYTADVFASAEELLRTDRRYEIILLDIEMRGMNGIEAAEVLRKNGHEEYIIFLTSHAERMPEAFKVKAFRFLQKPLSEAALREVLEEAEQELLSNEKILIRTEDGVQLIRRRDILFVESMGDGSCIYTVQENMLTGKSLKYWMSQLGTEHFCQTHKSYFVALRHVKKIGKTEIIMDERERPVPVSRRKQAEIKQVFADYIRKYARFM